MMDRRTFLAGLGATALVLAAQPTFAVTRPLTLWGDGEHDDTAALNALMDGKAVYDPDGKRLGRRVLISGSYLMSGKVLVPDGATFECWNCRFIAAEDSAAFECQSGSANLIFNYCIFTTREHERNRRLYPNFRWFRAAS